MTNLASNLADTARAHAGRVAVRVGDATMTYRELDEASARVAGLLRERGLKPGDRVGIMLPDVAEFPVVYYGVLRAGGVVVPMNQLLKTREVAYYLGDSGARLIFAWHSSAGEANSGAGQADAEVIVVGPASFPDFLASAVPDHEVTDRDDQDTAVILYTSGTTGQPKGAELTHTNLTSNAKVVCTALIRPYGAFSAPWRSTTSTAHGCGRRCRSSSPPAAATPPPPAARFCTRTPCSTASGRPRKPWGGRSRNSAPTLR
jgi:long-chain acyl-CoA synthetase